MTTFSLIHALPLIIAVLASLLLQVTGTTTHSHETVAPPTAVSHIRYLRYSILQQIGVMCFVRQHTSSDTNPASFAIFPLNASPLSHSSAQHLSTSYASDVTPNEPNLHFRRKNDRARLSKSSYLRTCSNILQRKNLLILFLISEQSLP